MPSRLRTRATLMPPPPGSRWPGAHRILVKGAILVTDVERSTAGFMVSVTIWGTGSSGKAFDLSERAQTQERHVVFQNEVGRYRREIAVKPTLVLETGAKLGTRKIIRHLTKNTARDIDAALRPQRQRQISGNGPEHGTKHVDRGPAGGAAAGNAIAGNLRCAAMWQGVAIHRRQRFIEVLQSAAGQDAF